MANITGGTPSMGGAPQQPPPVAQGPMAMDRRMQRVPASMLMQNQAQFGGASAQPMPYSAQAMPGVTSSQMQPSGQFPPVLNQMQNQMQRPQLQNAGGPFSGKTGMASPQPGGKLGQPSPQAGGKLGQTSQQPGGKSGMQSPQGPFAGKSGVQSQPSKFGGPGKFGGQGGSGKFGGGAPPMNGSPVPQYLASLQRPGAMMPPNITHPMMQP